MEIRCLGALDNFARCLLTVDEWLGRLPEHADYELSRSQAMEEFNRAKRSLQDHPYWEDGDMSCEPHVCYTPETDGHYFLFKLRNNGSTFMVGERLPEQLVDW